MWRCSSQNGDFRHLFSFAEASLQKGSYLAEKRMSVYGITPAEQAFLEGGPFFHLCTAPLESEVFYETDSERVLAVNYMAISVMEADVKLLAFAIMSNHFHFVFEGNLEQVTHFWDVYRNYLSGYFNRHKRPGLMSRISAGNHPISNLRQLQNTIAYVIRNSFSARADVHVFADPWSTGYLYFNPMLRKEGIPLTQLKGQGLRDFTKTRNAISTDGRIYVRDGQAQFWSFVDYCRVQEFYDSARQFIQSVLKNVEGLIEVSLSIGEKPLLSDDELYPIVFKMCRERLKAQKPSELNIAGQKQLALWLKQEYHAGNKQIARMTRLPLSDVDGMFPLSKGARA